MTASLFEAEEPTHLIKIRRKSKPCWTNKNFASIFLNAAFTFGVLNRNRTVRAAFTGEEYGRIARLYKMLNHPREELEKDLVGLRIFANAQNKLSPKAHIVDSDAIHRILRFVNELKSILDDGIHTVGADFLHLKEFCLALYRAGKSF